MLRALCAVLLVIPTLAFAAQGPVDLDQKIASEYKVKGYEAQMRGDLPQARFLYERAEVLAPDDPGLLNDLGLINEALGNSDEAEEHYLKALAVDFKCLPAYSNLGYLYTARGNVDLASQYFEKRVKLGDPRDPRTLEAQSEVERLVQFSRNLSRKKTTADQQVLENIMVLRAKESTVSGPRAMVINAEVDYQRGLRFFESRRYDAARRSFEMCLAASKGHKGAAHMLERIKGLARMPSDADVKVVRPDKEHMIAMTEYEKGLRFLRDGYREEALKAFDRALSFAPSDADIQTARRKAMEN